MVVMLRLRMATGLQLWKKTLIILFNVTAMLNAQNNGLCRIFRILYEEELTYYRQNKKLIKRNNQGEANLTRQNRQLTL